MDIRRVKRPKLLFSISLSAFGGGVNSVAVKNGIVAAAVEADVKQDNGSVVLFDTNGNFLNQLAVGALPDMLTFSTDGKTLMVANEGEPNDDYTNDPEGSVSIIRIHGKATSLTQSDVTQVTFDQFNPGNIDPNIRIYGPNATVAQDLEPEYIAIAKDNKTAWVSLQENNAFAIIDIQSATVSQLVSLGTKNHNVIQNALDASNKDDKINLQPWPVQGFYMPDSIASYRYQGKNFVVSANEGDSRDYEGFSEEKRIGKLTLDAAKFPNAAELQLDENLGRLKSTTANGDSDGDGDIDTLFSYGARSFSIWDANGKIVFDSGSDFARITAHLLPDNFNSTNDENDSFDNRSDDKGTEPEALTIGTIRGKAYAFIGLERMGGVMIYNISNPYSPQFVQYINNRDFSGDPVTNTAKDLGPEGMTFIPENQSPIRAPLLIVSNEVSGSTTIYKLSHRRR